MPGGTAKRRKRSAVGGAAGSRSTSYDHPKHRSWKRIGGGGEDEGRYEFRFVVRVEPAGLSPAGRLQFMIPQVRMIADYVLGKRDGSRELAPHMMVLLPEEGRLCLVYRTAFTAQTHPDMEGSTPRFLGLALRWDVLRTLDHPSPLLALAIGTSPSEPLSRNQGNG